MPGDFASTICFHKLRTIIRELMGFSSLTSGVNGGVLQKQNRILTLTCHYLAVDLALEIKTSLIAHVVWGKANDFKVRQDYRPDLSTGSLGMSAQSQVGAHH
jgi:hypothetical protein